MHWHRSLGVKGLGQAAEHFTLQTKPFHRRRPNESVKYGHCGMQQMPTGQKSLASLGFSRGNDTPLGRGFFGKFLQPPQTRYISATSLSGTLFGWAWLEIWEAIHCPRTCYLTSAFCQGCQITKIIKFKKLERYSFAQVREVLR